MGANAFLGPCAGGDMRAADFSGAGNTIQLGFDFLGEPINAHSVYHIVRTGKGQGSFARMVSSGESIIFTVMYTPMPAGIYLAVVHAGGDAKKVSARADVYPSGQFQLLTERTGSKFLIPFEMPASGGLSLNLRIGMDDPGELTIYRVDMTRVS